MSKNIKIILLIFSLLYLLFLPFRPLISPDETRYAEISREMISSGDWVVPRMNNLRYFEKPIMGYWLNSISMLLFGQNNFGVRFASALAVMITTLLLYAITKKQFGATKGLFTASAYMFTAAVFIIGTVSVLDSMLTMVVTAAAAMFYFAFHSTSMNKRLLYLAIFGLSVGVAFLIKGFLVFVVLGLTTGGYLVWEFSQDKFKRLKQRSLGENIKLSIVMLFAILLPLLLITLPWSIMIYHREPDFWRFFFIEEHLHRFMAKDAQHAAPWFFYLPVLLIGLLPWTLLLPVVVPHWRSFKLNIPLIKYSLCWFLLPFIFFSTSKGKLPTYILPCIPPLVILFTFGLEQFFHNPEKNSKWVRGVIKFFIGTFAIAAIALPILQLSGIPGVKLMSGKPLIIFSSSEWWKLGSIIIILALGVSVLIRALKINNSRKKIYYFMAGVSALFIISMIAIPRIALAAKTPGYILLKQQKLINAQTVIATEHSLARDLCWFYKRNNIYLLFSVNEFGYGINYSEQTKKRLIRKGEFRTFAQKHTGNLVVILTRKHYQKYLIKYSLLSQPKQVIFSNSLAFLKY
ncbi:MAG: glycosyltransferase family 39 protein [Victivallaceae bacterium]|nr:glycosyltransferase family 39 protein [Victivallaceae bacterium]